MLQYEPKHKRKQAVLSAVWNIVLEHGAELDFEEFAYAVGMSIKEFSRFFPTRSALILSLIDWVDARENVQDLLLFCMNIKDPLDRFNTTLESWLDFVPKVFPVALEFTRLQSVDLDIAATMDNRFELTRQWFLGSMIALHEVDMLAANWSPKMASDFMWVQSSFEMWALFTLDCGWRQERAKLMITQTITTTLLRSSSCPKGPL